jgi:hypothetical protein
VFNDEQQYLYEVYMTNNKELIESRISELNDILSSDFRQNTWVSNKSIAHVHYQGAWANILESLKKITSLDSNNKSKFASKIRKSDDYRKSRELGGEIILASIFTKYSPKFEKKTNSKKDVDIFLELSTGQKIAIEVTTINMVPKQEKEMEEDIKSQTKNSSLAIHTYYDISYKRIKTAIKEKIDKFVNQENYYNLLCLYNIAQSDDQDLANALIGKFSYPIDINTGKLKDPVLTEKGIWLNSDTRYQNIHGICTFDWNLEKLSVLYNPLIKIPPEVKEIFSDFTELTGMELI